MTARFLFSFSLRRRNLMRERKSEELGERESKRERKRREEEGKEGGGGTREEEELRRRFSSRCCKVHCRFFSTILLSPFSIILPRLECLLSSYHGCSAYCHLTTTLVLTFILQRLWCLPSSLPVHSQARLGYQTQR